MPWKLSELVPFPFFDTDKFDEANWSEIQRLKAAGREVFVRKLDGGKYEIIDGADVETRP